MAERIGERFQIETGYYRNEKPNLSDREPFQPELYKEYPGSKKIALSSVENIVDMPLADTLRNRKSVRKFSGKPVSKKVLSYILWATSGISHTKGDREYRTAPSAGGQYPLENYILVNNVDGIPPGLYHYSIRDHVLEELGTGSVKNEVVEAAKGQKMVSDCAFAVISSATFIRMTYRYKDRGYRYIYQDSGHMIQNLALACTSMGLGSCQMGSFFEDAMNEAIGLDGIEESVIYMSVVGYSEK